MNGTGDQVIRSGALLDHIGIAVKAIAVSRPLYESLGLSVGEEEVIDHEQVKVAMFQLGESRVELLEPTSQDSVISNFIAKRGEGIHHIAIKTESIDGLFERLAAAGVRLASSEIKVGAGGHRYFFIHPSSAGGVLIEIVE